jgi:hypothetical protein
VSALDAVMERVLGNANEHRDRAEAEAALVELALLRRCRDAVVGLRRAMERRDGKPWWLNDFGDHEPRCLVCDHFDDHFDDCPALAIDALAKEVTP